MVRQQRRVAAGQRVVMVGRDVGTIVLPGAGLKVYLDAGVEERARRRWREERARGSDADYDRVLASMRGRDEIDSGRQVAPLRPADDAVVLDTSGLDVDQVLAELERLVEERRACPGG
jgi:cytidylate kinase